MGTVPDGKAIRLKSKDFNGEGGWVSPGANQSVSDSPEALPESLCWPSKKITFHQQPSPKGSLPHTGSLLHLLLQFPSLPVMLPVIRAGHTPHVRAAARVKQDTNNEQATNDDNRFQHRQSLQKEKRAVAVAVTALFFSTNSLIKTEFHPRRTPVPQRRWCDH